jgi:hypothetical protein
MRNLKAIACIAIMVMVAGHTEVSAQFENKVTFNFALGTIKPIGVKEYIYKTNNQQYVNTWLMPFLFSNFSQGFTFTGGAQFNINRYFAIGTGVGVERIGSWKYMDTYSWNGTQVEIDFLSWELTNEGTVLKQGVNELNLYNLSIGVFPRINLAYGKKLNPYLFVEITFNYTDINYIDKRRDAWISLGGSEQSYDDWYNSLTSPSAFRHTPQSSFGIGLYPGFGFDLNVTKNFGLFLQGGYSFISINKADLEEANLEPENFNNIKVEVGVKVSFLRSKDI